MLVRVLPAAVLAVVAVVALAVFVLGRDDGPDTGEGAPARPAAAFTDSVGVNIHLTYVDTAYGDFDRVRQALRTLGVRHVRDGVVLDRDDQVERLLELGRSGVRASMISGTPGVDVDRILEVLRRVRPALAAIEGPNEVDATRQEGWPARLRAYQRDLYARAKADPALRSLPVFGPSFIFPESRRDLGDLAGALDAGNLHPYPGGGPPEDNLARERDLAALVSADEPLVSTETGYHNALRGGPEGSQPGVSEVVAGDYAPRLFLSAFAAGIRRSYWYELLDQFPDRESTNPEASFGLFSEEGAPKPAATAIANLLRVTGDGDGAAAEEAPALDVAVRSGDDGVRRLLLRKADGTYVLAIWRNVRIADDEALRALDADPVEVDVELPDGAGEVVVHRPSRSAEPVARETDVRELRVPLAGDATLLEIRP
jgi:hypothetical protein